MKRKSILKRIFKLTLVSLLASLIVVGAVNIAGMLFLRDNTASVYSELSETVISDSMVAFGNVAGNDAEKLVRKRAELMDEKLGAWRNAAEALASVAEDIVRNPQSYNANPLDPDMFWLWYAENTDISLLEEAIGLMGNVQGVMRGITRSVGNTSVCYVGTESGFYITGSRPPDQGETFEPRGRPWYIAAKAAGSTAWTDIYEDAFGLGLAVTCATPFYDINGNLAGVAGVDVFLNDLDWIINDGKSWESETSFVLDENGNVIVSGDMPGGINFNDIDDSSHIITSAMLDTLPWTIVTVIDLDEVFEPLSVMHGNISSLTERSVNYILSVILVFIVIFIVLITATAVVTGGLSHRFARSLTKPITVLEHSLGLIAGGNLDTVIDIKTGDEIESLAVSVNSMTVELKDYINNLAAVTAEKERIGAELNVAKQIQSNMLPCIFPAFPDRAEFDIYASMRPAKEVGGDFYDFFLIGDNTLAVVMADVSGKGVPAALFMVIAKTLIKNNAQNGKSPKEVFETVNNLLCENNEAGMFVTVILGYLDIPTGKFTFVNAGHNPPLLRVSDGNPAGSKYEWLKTKPGFVLAGMEDMFYKQHEITLKPNDELFLYTDGITEAVNNENELFTDPRLLETVNNYLDLPLKEFTVSIKREIDKFADGAEQADDITMLVLRYGDK